MTEGNHYVYRRRWCSPRLEEKPFGGCIVLKDRLVHTTSRNKKVIKHSTHNHPLLSYKNILKEDKAVCSICEIDIIGLAYGCDQDCDFLIHKSCLHTPVTIKHWSHPHPLTLLTSSGYALSVFSCNTCYDKGEGYHYHCSTCSDDFHVSCAGLPQTVQNNRHRYPLTLFSVNPIKNKETIDCSFCHDLIILEGWIYYNKDSEFVAHLDCAFTEEIEESVFGIQERLLALKVAT